MVLFRSFTARFSARATPSMVLTRGLQTTRMVRQSSPVNAEELRKAAPTKIVYTRKGSVRSALFGLFFGATFASIFGASYLVEEIQKANVKLLSTVDDLYKETEKVRGYLKRIDELEKQMQVLESKMATKDHVSKVNDDMRRLYDQTSRDQLSLRAQIRDVEQDIHAALKSEGKTINL
ncbi:hypothetical protein H4R33_005308 [Dimargaris cristalligena]|uniref:Uncharacterized protein n=1 Tax=Dimargaris cristalligena TaxID=215637 RepID=A0A4P9ZK95_9FUNG|nr:hypothetical protein H4R33_005308 [Dimargaris cristalligena]RKP33657.1 hypothetical protein BJ085DRAFT_32191 [Dimargaris cristalligena]|eukprot:RKP33657.1 hypothetical protein BJ085DRAFT_32191 [Dimargaris cristalligena]